MDARGIGINDLHATEKSIAGIKMKKRKKNEKQIK